MHAKKILQKPSWIMIVIFLLCKLCNLTIGQTGTFQAVPAERIPGILNTISNHIHENFRRIHTWQGETEVSWYIVYEGETAKDIFMRKTDGVGEAPNRVVQIAESTTTFCSDLAKGLLYAKVSRKTPSVYIDPVDKRDLGTRSISWYKVSIRTPEYDLHCSPSRMKDGYPVQQKAVKQTVLLEACQACDQPSIFDPRDLFDARSPVWLQYPSIVERIREKGEYVVDEYALKVEELILPDTVQYRVHEPTKSRPHGNTWFIKTYSSDAGYNMISWEQTTSDGRLMHRRSVEYQLVEGVYVPSKETKENFDPEDGSLQYKKTRTFKNVRLNRAIPTERFTYKSLELEDGDVFEDRILDKKYIHSQGQLSESQKR